MVGGVRVSERKTTEFKMRVAESDKTAWQLAAEEEGIGLSEFARRAMNDRAGGGATSSRLAWVDREPYSSMMLVDYASHDLAMAKSRGESIEDYRLALHAVSTPEGEDFPVAQDVPTSSEVDLVDTLGPAIAAEVRGEEPKSWMFEARSGD